MPIDQTTIKTLYVFVEIGIDSSHLAETIRLNLPCDRETFHKELLESEESDANIPAGQQLRGSRYLRIEGPDFSGDSGEQRQPEHAAANQVPTRLALVSTIQFVAALQKLKESLTVDYMEPSPSFAISKANLLYPTDNTLAIQNFKPWPGKYDATIPRSKPLSPGEILGCTAPTLHDTDALMSVPHLCRVFVAPDAKQIPWRWSLSSRVHHDC